MNLPSRNSDTPSSNWQLLSSGLLAIVIVTVNLVGCSNTSVSEIEDLETVAVYSQANQLGQTMEYIWSTERYETREFREKVNSGLNRWITGLKPEEQSEWKMPDLVSTLPKGIDESKSFKHIQTNDFYANDAEYIQQVAWFKEISDRVSKSNFIYNQELLFQTALRQTDEETKNAWKESNNLLADALKVIHPELEATSEDLSKASQVEQLAESVKLFDWTIRNVHILDAPEWPTEETIKNEGLVLDSDTKVWPAISGTNGPGYTHYPWQVLTYGKGDFLERALIFANLCEQREIPVVILAFPNEDTESSRPYTEWLCAAEIGGELFLFDTRLGLPIPSEKPGSIATLSEIKANPKLLRNLDLTIEESVEKTNYPVTEDMLEEIVALIVAAPESISRRMRTAQDSLPEASRLKLTVDVDRYAERFRKHAEVSDVKMWHVPFSNLLFRQHVESAMISAGYDSDIQQRVSWIARDESYIDAWVQLRTARNSFLKGIFESDLDKGIRSAISYYYSFMYTDQQIAEMGSDELLQRRLGILRDVNQPYKVWQNRLATMQRNMGLVRADAAFYMSMSHYENGYPATSLKWLERSPDYDDEKRWTKYLKYHMGRAHEASGNYPEAAAAYGRDETAQRHGSLLRKRWLEKLYQDTL